MEYFCTDVCFRIKYSFVMPVGMGLFTGIIFHVSNGLQVILYFFLNGVNRDATTLGGVDRGRKQQRQRSFVALNQLLGNRKCILYLQLW